MKTNIKIFSSVKKIVAMAFVVLIATTSVGYADFATVRQKIQNMVAADSGDFGYIFTNIFDLTSGQIKEEFLEPTSPIWSLNSGDTYYNSGSVGIGTSSPGALLQVTKDQNSLTYLDVTNVDTGTSAGSILRLITQRADNGGTTSADIVKYKTGLFKIANYEPTGDLMLETAGSERLRIKSDGKVGIGTSDPSYILDVHSGVGYVGINPADGSIELGSPNDNYSFIDFKGSSTLGSDYDGRMGYNDTTHKFNFTRGITVAEGINTSCIGNCF